MKVHNFNKQTDKSCEFKEDIICLLVIFCCFPNIFFLKWNIWGFPSLWTELAGTLWVGVPHWVTPLLLSAAPLQSWEELTRGFIFDELFCPLELFDRFSIWKTRPVDWVATAQFNQGSFTSHWKNVCVGAAATRIAFILAHSPSQTTVMLFTL